MSLIDHQTGQDIISPYIAIGKGKTRYAVNTETFRDCQEWLITPESLRQDTTSEQFRELPDSSLAQVFAVTGDYNNGAHTYGIMRTVSCSKPAKLELLIGFIPLSVLKEHAPKVYTSVQESKVEPVPF